MKQRCYSYLFFVISVCTLVSCGDDKGQKDLLIEEETVLDSIPSASGMVLKDTMVFIIGDDATGIYHFNLLDHKSARIPLNQWPGGPYRLPKSAKHDFESGTFIDWNGKEYLLAFGSGSGVAPRDSMLLLNTAAFTDQKIISLNSFYRRLRQITNTDSSQWNIEGAAIIDQYLFLCNRGSNTIYKIQSPGFMNYLFDTSSAYPQVEYQRLELPSIQGKPARLSGACALSNGDILMVASVEDTPDWISDGPVLGSFVCLFSPGKKKLIASYLLKDMNGQPLKEKLETLEVLNKDPLTIVALSDNDGGVSKLFRLVISSRNK